MNRAATQPLQNHTPAGRPCRLACRLEVLPGNTLRERLHNAARFGFDAVALPGRFLETYRDALSALVPNLPICLSSLSLGFEGSLVSAEAGSRRRCRDSLVRLFDLCVEWNVNAVNMPPLLTADNPAEGGADAEAADLVDRRDRLLADELPPVLEEARARRVRLLLEPVNRYESAYMNTVAHAARVCRSVDHPSLGITIDFFHMQIEEVSAAAAIDGAAACIGLVHVAENTRVEPGPGCMRFAEGFSALKRAAYDGPLEVECRTLSGPAERVLPRAAAYLRETWRAA